MPHQVCDQPPQRSFLLIRLSLASFIVFFHSFPLGGFGSDILQVATNGKMNGGIMTVRAFFTISGFLLTLSLIRNPSLPRYCIRRIFRIFPGYWGCLTVTSFVLLPFLFHTLTRGNISYFEAINFGRESAIDYWLNNLSLMIQQSSVRPVFQGNPYPYDINGSLWTLFYEATCYTFLGVSALCGLFKAKQSPCIPFALLYFAACIHVFRPIPLALDPTLTSAIFNTVFHPGAEAFGISFTGGVFAAILYQHRQTYNVWLFVLAISLLTLSARYAFGLLIWPLAIPYILISISECSFLRHFEKMPDFSYGVYLYAFLVQQSLVMFGWASPGFWMFFILSLGTSLIMASLSWFLIEKPAIAFGERLIKSARETST